MKRHISIFALLLTVLVGLSASAAWDTDGAWYFVNTYAGRIDYHPQTPACLSRSFADGVTTFTAIPPAGMNVINWGWADGRGSVQQHNLIKWNGETTPTYSWPDSDMVVGYVGVVKFGYIPFAVTFNANGGTGKMDPITGLNIISNFTLTANAFTKTGYHFTGWMTNLTKGVVFKDGASLTGADLWNGTGFNSTFYAQWVPNTYTVHFDGNGATSGSMADEIFTYDETKVLTANAFERDGFAFAGWATNAVAGAVVYEDKKSVGNLTTNDNETVNLYARWTQKYKVTFREDGKFNDTTPHKDGILKVEYVERYGSATPPDDPSHEGYRFLKWSGNYTGVTKDENVYATYQGESYRIILHANDGSGRVSEDPRVYGEEAKALLPMTRTGYELNGWAESPDAIGPKYQPSQEVANLATKGEVHLYALWTPISYSVAFDKNGGEGTMDPVALEYGEAYVVPECKFTKTGCEFQSWQVLVGGKVVTNFLAGTTVSNLTSEAGGSVTFKAEWLGRYKIAFDANGGEGMMETTNVERDVGFQLPSNAFTRTGYDFTMWTTNLPPSDKSIIADGATVTNLVAAGETCTLHALWDAHHYTITFDANGGKGEMPAHGLAYDEPYTLPECTFAAPKYSTFLYWSTSATDTSTVYQAGETVSNLTAVANGTVPLYAIWKYDVGRWSDVLDCNNLMFFNDLENEKDYKWEIVQEGVPGTTSTESAMHDKYGKISILYADLDESGTISYCWKGEGSGYPDDPNYLSVCTNGIEVSRHNMVDDTDWTTNEFHVDVIPGQVVTIQFKHNDPSAAYLDCVTWTPDGDHPVPVDGKDNVTISSAAVLDGKFTLSFPFNKDFDYLLKTNANLLIDSWGVMDVEGKKIDNILTFEPQIIEGQPQLFYKVETIQKE